jgi:hypothetical protein
MLTLKLVQLVSAVDSKALGKLEGAAPPWAVRFACARLTEAVLTEYRRYEKLYGDLVRQFGVKDGDKIAVYHKDNTEANMTAFSAALQELLASEVKLAVEPISATKLGEMDLTIGEVRCLGPLLTE